MGSRFLGSRSGPLMSPVDSARLLRATVCILALVGLTACAAEQLIEKLQPPKSDSKQSVEATVGAVLTREAGGTVAPNLPAGGASATPMKPGIGVTAAPPAANRPSAVANSNGATLYEGSGSRFPVVGQLIGGEAITVNLRARAEDGSEWYQGDWRRRLVWVSAKEVTANEAARGVPQVSIFTPNPPTRSPTRTPSPPIIEVFSLSSAEVVVGSTVAGANKVSWRVSGDDVSVAISRPDYGTQSGLAAQGELSVSVDRGGTYKVTMFVTSRGGNAERSLTLRALEPTPTSVSVAGSSGGTGYAEQLGNNRFRISAREGWQSTGVFAPIGRTVAINYVGGQWRITPNSPYTNHEGYPAATYYRNPRSDLRSGVLICRLNGPLMAIVEPRLGAFRNGAEGTIVCRINDDVLSDNDGAIDIQIAIY